MPQNNARFIVFEGLDGAGTTTQAARLHAHFTQRGASGFLTHEPTAGPIGTFIRRLLTGKEPGNDGKPYRPDEHAMGLLFAADRLAHSSLIAAALARGHVVCDRYLLSSMAYQTLDASISAEWVMDVNRGCAIPDLTLFVAVPVKVCLDRIGARNAEKSIYESKTQLDKIAANYERMLALYEKQFGRVVRIDGNQSIQAVHAAVVSALNF